MEAGCRRQNTTIAPYDMDVGSKTDGETANNKGDDGGNYIREESSERARRKELMVKAEIYQKGMAYKDALTRLHYLLGTNSEIMLQNRNSSENARLSKTSVGKLMSNATFQKSIDNGFTREQHYAVASDANNLFERSLKLWERPDSNGETGVFIHRFAAPLHFGNAVAYITLKESRQHGGKRIHTAEVVEIGKLGGIEEARDKSPTLHSAPNFNESNINKILQGQEKVNSQDKKINKLFNSNASKGEQCSPALLNSNQNMEGTPTILCN